MSDFQETGVPFKHIMKTSQTQQTYFSQQRIKEARQTLPANHARSDQVETLN